jgi:hypothetical protein
MLIQINKIRTKLQLQSLLLVLLAVAIGIVAYAYIYRVSSYDQLKDNIDELLILNPKITRYAGAFLKEDAQSERFLKDGESSQLRKYQQYILQTRELFLKILQNPLIEKIEGKENLKTIHQLILTHHKVFMSLVEKIKYRGFKDYGLEGKMRNAIHTLQNIDSLNQISLLTLRRYEKDYLLRKDLFYLDSLKSESKRLIQYTEAKINKKDSVSLANLANITQVVHQYVTQFEKIVKTEYEIGIHENAGLKAKINETANQMEKELAVIDQHIDASLEAQREGATWMIRIFLVIIFILALLLAIFFPHEITKNIVRLDIIAKSVTKELD